jgi:4-amino-4-deoxy-L-arabinose transferase-like glycosyltransferase
MALTRPLSQTRFSSNFLLISLLVLVAAFALLWRLGTGSLAAWDEAIYAEVSKEMLTPGNWLTLHWQYQPWFEKPPLFIWISALFFRVFGVSELWARVPSALSGIGLIAVTYLIGKFKYGERVGILAAVVLLTSYNFLSFSRFGTMDVMLTLFTYVAVYAYLRLNNENQKWWYLVWFSCALALMVKGAGGVIAPAAIALALVVDKRVSAAIRSKHFWQGMLLALLIVAPWHVLMYVWYGRTFLDEYIGYHVIARSTKTLEGHASGYFYYVGKLVDGFFPWSLLAPFAVVAIIRKREPRSWILPILSALVFGLYTLIPTRRPWYIIPLYPALAILIAAFISNLYQGYKSRPLYRRLVAAACGVLIIVGALYSFVSLYFNHKPEEPLAKLSRLAQSTSPDDRDSLLLLSGVEPIYAQVSLFYSNRPIQQTYALSKPASEDARRYVNYESLANLTQTSAKRMILRKDDIQLLSGNYEILVVAEADSLAYAWIRRR